MSLLRYGAIMPPMRLTEQVGYPTGYLSPWYEWTEVGERPLYFEGHWNGSAVVPLEQWEGQEWFTPLHVSGCSTWLDAADSTTLTLSGSNVTAWLDKSTNAYSLTPVATGPQSGTRTINGLNALDFTGSQALRKSAVAISDPTTYEWTVFCVVQMDALTGTQQLLNAISGGTSNVGSITFVDSTPKTINYGTDNAAREDLGPSASIGQPYVFRGTHHNGLLEARLNGVTNGSTAMNRTARYQAVNFTVGATSLGTPAQFMDGLVGEVIVYPRELNEQEIAQVESYLMTKWGIAHQPWSGYAKQVFADSPLAYWRMDEPAGTYMLDSSGNGFLGTYYNTPSLGATGLIGDGTAVTFDGTNESAQLAHTSALNATGAWTMECWVKITSPTADKLSTCMDKTGLGSGAGQYCCFYDNRASQGYPHRFAMQVGGSNYLAYVVDTAEVGAGGHLVCTVSGSGAGQTIRMYWNGSEVASTDNRTISWSSSNTTPLTFGLGAGIYGALTLDEVAIYSTELSAERIAAHYAARV